MILKSEQNPNRDDDIGVALRVEGLSKTYGEHKALDQVSFKLKKSECLAILGPNGAGKTTLCDILMGLTLSDEDLGQVVFEGGLSLKTNRNDILETLGVQLQETSLYKKYTVLETFQLFASFYKKTPPIDPLLKSLGLEEKKHARLESLSGGQKQRVYLGCALVHEPKVLFLDEPTTGLDPKTRHDIWSLLADRQKKGCSILLTTHSMEEATLLADHVMILDQGSVIAYGACRQLIKTHCKEEILRFSFANSFSTSLEQLLNTLPFADQHYIYQQTVHLPKDRDHQDPIKILLEETSRLGVVIQDVSLRASCLEDVFIKLTGRSITRGG